MTPFEVLDLDIDNFITVINYLMNVEQTETNPKPRTGKKTEQRIRVNDKTATGGWW